MGKVLGTEEICNKLKRELQEEAAKLVPLTLASLEISRDYSSEIYLSSQRKLSELLGIDYRLIKLGENIPVQKVLEKIDELNKDCRTTGIIVNKPFPSGWEEEDIYSAIDAGKDIEGMSSCNLGRLFRGKPFFVSPTVLSILELLKMSGVKLYGKQVTIVGFSTLIGKPLALFLGRELATVTITHIATYKAGQLPFYVKKADILISAAGVPQLIKGEWIKEGAVVIDVGLGEREGRVCGDVEFEEAKRRASFLTPVPGGVGRLTTIFLFKNLIKAAKLKTNKNDEITNHKSQTTNYK